MNLLEKEHITPDTLGMLLFLKMNTSPTEYVSETIKTYLFDFKVPDTDLSFSQIFEEKGWVEYTKTGKKALHYRIRLSKKGEEIIKQLNQKPEHPLASECWDILKETYEKYQIDKSKIINKTKTTFYISEFLYEKENQNKAYTPKMFKAVVYDYLNSFGFDKKHFAKKTLNLIYDPSNTYASKWNLEDSPLWDWSDKNKESIKLVYGKL